jgi:hypothetical protein
MNSQVAQSLKFFGPLGVLVRPMIVATILFGLWRALNLARIGLGPRKVFWWITAILLTGWLGLVWLLAAQGTFASFSTISPGFQAAMVAVTVLLPVAVAVIAGGISTTMTAALDAAPLSWLVGVQVYRVLGFIFVRLWSHGLLPAYFGLPAGIGDTLVGVTALPLAFALRSNTRLTRGLALGWNVFGILDLVNAVTMGVTSALVQSTPNISPLPQYPLALIPAFGVPLSLILHGLSFRQLRRRAIPASTGATLNASSRRGSLTLDRTKYSHRSL